MKFVFSPDVISPQDVAVKTSYFFPLPLIVERGYKLT